MNKFAENRKRKRSRKIGMNENKDRMEGFSEQEWETVKRYLKEKNAPELQFYFAMVPQELLEDKEISGNAVKLFGLLHCQAWDKKNPVTETISQKWLARKMGVSVKTIHGYEKELELKGWIKIQRRGLNLPDKIRLIFVKKRA
jgi:hypothetical protein